MICPCGECPRNSCRNDLNFLGHTQHSCGSTCTLLSRHGSLRLMAVPHQKTQLKGILFESRDDIFTENSNVTPAAYTLYSHDGCTRQTLSAGEKKSTSAHEGTFHLPSTAHLPCFISFREKNTSVTFRTALVPCCTHKEYTRNNNKFDVFQTVNHSIDFFKLPT